MTQEFALQTSREAAASDELALIAAAAGRPEAFGELYQRYLSRVYRYLRTRAASGDDARDLTQTVFLRAFTGLARYRRDRTPFAAWLFRIARNAAIDARRRQRPTIPWELVTDMATGEDRDSSPAVRVEERERAAHLRMLIGRLDDHKRELLALKYAAGLSTREIAATLGKSEHAVKKMMTRTLSALKEQYDEPRG